MTRINTEAARSRLVPSSIQVGSILYKIHSNLTMSGGIECGVIYDDTDTHIDCLAQLPAGSELAELAAHAPKSCFEDHQNRSCRL